MPSSQGAEQELAEAIEALYHVFALYLLAERVEGCPCCVSEADKDRLHGKPLRALAAADLERYARKAMTTWGATEDFKHFLPRLFELVTAEESILDEIDAQVLFGKLTYAHWRQWPQQEQEAVDGYLSALWAYFLSLSPKVASLDDLLTAYGQAVDDLAPYLETWVSTKTAFSLGHYFDFLDQNEAILRRGYLQNDFWPKREGQMRQVVEWVTSPETDARMAQMLYL